MARNKKEMAEISPELQEVMDREMPDAKPLYSPEEIALARQADAVQNEKYLIIKTLRELKEQEAMVRASYTTLCNEFNMKQRSIEFLIAEINAQNVSLHNIKEAVKKERSEQIARIEDMEAKLKEANETYNKLISDNKEKANKLKNELDEIEEERRSFKEESERLERHVKQVENASKALESDLKDREAELSRAREEFEAYKSTLEPDLLRISAIKNENQALITKINNDKSNLDKQLMAFEHEKSKLMSELEAEKAKLIRLENSIAIREAEIRKKEENLIDYDLEVRAREAAAQKVLKRQQLQHKIDEAKKE